MLRKGYFLIFTFIFSFSSAFAVDFDEGIEYALIKSPVTTSQPDKVVVTEVFWYGCPHCFRLEPYVKPWKQKLPEGVVFEQVPSVLNPRWMEHARAFLALQMMGEGERLHDKIFNAIHLQKKALDNVDEMAAFVATQGVDEKKFRDTYHSFPVDTQLRKNRQLERKYGHNGVPAIIVNGKYLAVASMAGSNARLMQVVDFLVNKELAAKK